jgi:two-component system response regulator
MNGHDETILLVEDDPKDELLIRRSLEKAGIGNAIVTAWDGVEAIDHLLDPGRPLPALVLLDLGLPRLDGHQVLARIRAEKRTELLPVVILTSSDEESDIQRSYRNGANSYVRKPVNFDDFLKIVRDVGLYWLLTNVPPDHDERDQP